MKKAFLFIAALAMSVSLSAEKITTVAGITSGNKYYVGATTGEKDYYFYVDGSAKTESIKGVAKEDVADAVALTFTAVTDGWTIQFDNGLYLGIKNAKDNGAVQVMEEPVVWKIEENTDKGLLMLHPNDYYLQKNNSGTQFGSYKNTQTNVWLESAGAAPTPATLDSLVIKGKATKMEYKVGEAFDPAGLEVWGIYTKTVKHDSTSQIKSGITWTLDPETFEEAYDNASVTLVASYKELTTADTTITGIKVTEKPAPSGYAETYTSNVELSTEGGTSASAVKVSIDGDEYDAIKAGTGSVAGACVVTIPANTKTLHFHAAGWKGENVTLDVNGTEYALTADAGVTSSTPFILQNNPAEVEYFTLDPKGATTITFAATAGKRFVLFGVNAETGDTPIPPTKELVSLEIGGEATVLAYNVGDKFDVAGLTVTGTYDDASTEDVTSKVTWIINPETFAEASDNASVTLSASYKDLTSADTTITGINVKAAVVKMDVTFNFIENLYGHKGVSSGSGEDYVSDGDIAVGEKFNEDPAQIEFTVNGSTQTRFWDASNKHELRLYKGAEFVLSIVGDYKIIKVDFTGSAVNLESNGVTVSNKVWEGDAAKSVTFVNTATGSKINSIKVTYIAAAPAVANPTITADSVFNVYWNPITVTLACETEGAAIYYTIDGSEPTASATKYDAPFSVTATTTVKAIAIKSGLDNSEVVSKTFTFGTVFASLEELVANQPATDDVAYVQVTITNAEIDSFYVTTKGYTNGIFVTANGTAVELYTNDVPETWEAGGKVSGTIKAEWLLYKGTPELQKWDGGWEAFDYKAPGEPTGLQQVMMQGNIRKAMVNGRLIIVKGEKAFDLQGRIVK